MPDAANEPRSTPNLVNGANPIAMLDCDQLLAGGELPSNQHQQRDSANDGLPAEEWFARCRMCGAKWPIPQWSQPRKCLDAECEAGWLDIAMWRSEAEADAMVPDGGFSWPS